MHLLTNLYFIYDDKLTYSRFRFEFFQTGTTENSFAANSKTVIIFISKLNSEQ